MSSFRRHFCNVSTPPGFDTQRINLQYSGLTKTSTALPRLSSKRTIL
ncbi:AzlC family protein [Neisseria meningitidis]|nr:AzlC family protein [Neisseria meningitidis]